MEWIKDDFRISTDKTKIDIAFVHAFLTTSYWSEGITKDIVQRSINGSLCSAVFYKESQVGFARVITDEATFAYLCDVFIDENYQGKGLGKWLVETIILYHGLQGLRRFMLATKDAHDLYKKFGFVPVTFTNRWMHIHQPDLYKNFDGRKDG